jgi:hypothetical protein
MTADGTISEDVQHKTVDYLSKRLGVTKTPPLSKIFDYALTRRILAELQLRQWKPQP